MPARKSCRSCFRSSGDTCTSRGRRDMPQYRPKDSPKTIYYRIFSCGHRPSALRPTPVARAGPCRQPGTGPLVCGVSHRQVSNKSETKPKRRSSPGRGGRTRESSRVETFSFAPLGLPRARGFSGLPRTPFRDNDPPSGPLKAYFPSGDDTVGMRPRWRRADGSRPGSKPGKSCTVAADTAIMGITSMR